MKLLFTLFFNFNRLNSHIYNNAVKRFKLVVIKETRAFL